MRVLDSGMTTKNHKSSDRNAKIDINETSQINVVEDKKAYKMRVKTLITPMAFETRRDQRVLRMHTAIYLLSQGQLVRGVVLQRTMPVKTPTATPRTAQVVVSLPAATSRYLARTRNIQQINLPDFLWHQSSNICVPIALLLLNDSRTDRTAKAVGSKNFGFGYALSDMRISQMNSHAVRLSPSRDKQPRHLTGEGSRSSIQDRPTSLLHEEASTGCQHVEVLVEC